MNFTEWAIKTTRVTFVTLACLLLGGFLAYRNAPKAEDPGFSI